MNIIKSLHERINLIENKEGILAFAYQISEACGGGLGYYYEAQSLMPDENFNIVVKKLSDIIDIDTLELNIYEDGNKSATMLGLEDKNHVYVINLPKSAVGCDDIMYYAPQEE